MKEVCLSFIKNVLNTFDAMVAQVLTILGFNCFSSSDPYIGGMYDLALSVRALVMPISLTIITLIFTIEFLNVTMKFDTLKWEHAIKIIFKFVLAKVAIDIAATLMDAIYTTATEWITGIGSTTSTLGATAGALIKNEIENYGTLKTLGLMLSSAVMFLVIIACALIMNVIAYARIFEIMVYVSISPLPCAFLPSEHSRITVKFFCNFAGVCLQGVFMALSIKMYVVLCTTILGNLADGTSIWNVIYNLVIGSVVCLMAVIKSGQWANKLFDAM